MDIDIEWQEPIQLTQFKKIIVDEKKLPEEIENSGGVYFFSRKYGDTYEPFYIGETGKLKTRLGQHLKSKQLADVLRGINDSGKIIKAGDRFFHFGYFIAKGGQDGGKCRKIVQKILGNGSLVPRHYFAKCATNCPEDARNYVFWDEKSSRHLRQEGKGRDLISFISEVPMALAAAALAQHAAR